MPAPPRSPFPTRSLTHSRTRFHSNRTPNHPIRTPSFPSQTPHCRIPIRWSQIPIHSIQTRFRSIQTPSLPSQTRRCRIPIHSNRIRSSRSRWIPFRLCRNRIRFRSQSRYSTRSSLSLDWVRSSRSRQ